MGHTHEDVDQLFSRLAVKIRDGNSESVEHLMERVGQAYTPTPLVEEARIVADFSSWVAPHIQVMTGITGPHSFKIVAGEDERVKVYFKAWARRKEWQPGLDFITPNDILAAAGDLPREAEPMELETAHIKRAVQVAEKYFLRETSKDEWAAWFTATEEIVAQDTNPGFQEFIDWTMQHRAHAGGEAAHEVVVAEDMDSCSDEDGNLFIMGRRKRTPRDFNLDTPSLAVGQMVAVVLDEEENSLPYGLCKVLNLVGETMSIHWWGTKSRKGKGVWYPLQKRGTSQAFLQDLPKDCVLYSGFELSKGKKIPAATHRRIMRNYDSYMSEGNEGDGEGKRSSL